MKHTRPLILALALAATAGCGEDETAEAEPIIRPVRVERVGEAGGAQERTFSGASKASTEAKLSFKVAGTLNRLEVKVGDKVKKNALIASIEGQDFSLRVQEAKAGLQQASAQERNARSQYDRTKALYENNNATRADLDGARTQLDSARANVQASRKRLELAQTQAGYTRLSAPLDGVVAQVPVEKNENVQAGQTVVLLNAGERTEVEIPCPESLIAQIKSGNPATVRFDAIKGASFDATVTEVGVATGGATTTFPVTVRLNDEEERVRPGMAAEVTLQFSGDDQEKGIYVNPKAVGEDKSGRFAYVAVPGKSGFGAVQRRKVEVGQMGTRGLQITKGLKPGELVVTAGLSYLQDGKEVRLPKTSAKPTKTETPAKAEKPAPAPKK